MNEQEKIRLVVMFNKLKKDLKLSLDNNLYQSWNKGDKKIKFTNYVINLTIQDIDKIDMK